jgi:hypothetical protein
MSFVEYAKADAEDICIKITAHNRGRNPRRFTFCRPSGFAIAGRGMKRRTNRDERSEIGGGKSFARSSERRKTRRLFFDVRGRETIAFLRKRNEFRETLRRTKRIAFCAKDGINDFVVNKKKRRSIPKKRERKRRRITFSTSRRKRSETIYLRLSAETAIQFETRNLEQFPKTKDGEFIKDCERVFVERKKEADEFYLGDYSENLTDDAKNVMRQSLAGMLWAKQFYHYVVKTWLEGDDRFRRRRGKD